MTRTPGTDRMACPVCSKDLAIPASGLMPTHAGSGAGQLCPSSGWCTITGHDGKVTLPRAFFPRTPPAPARRS